MLTLLWYSVVVLDIFLLIAFFLFTAIFLIFFIQLSYDWIKLKLSPASQPSNNSKPEPSLPSNNSDPSSKSDSELLFVCIFLPIFLCGLWWTFGVFFESKNIIDALPFCEKIGEKLRSNEKKALTRLANIETLLPSTPEKIEIKKITTQLELFEKNKTKLIAVKNNFEKICLEIREDLRQKKVFSSKDLTTPPLRALATELAEVVTKKEAAEKQIIEIDRLLEVGRYATRRLSRATMVNDAESEEVKGQLGQFAEILSELDNKFRGTGTVSVAQSVDKIMDEQLKSKSGEKK